MEHWTQQPLNSLFIRFLQYTHFYQGDKDMRGGTAVRRKSYERQVKVQEVQGKERRRKETSRVGRMRGRNIFFLKSSKADPDTNWNTDMLRGKLHNFLLII